MLTLFRSAAVGCLVILPLYLWVGSFVYLFAQATTPQTPPAPNTVSIEIGPTLAGLLTMIALQLIAAFTAYLAYRRSVATEVKAGAIEMKVDTSVVEQKAANLKTDQGLQDIHVAVNSKYEKLEQKFTDSQAHVMALIEQLAAANAKSTADAASLSAVAVAKAKPEEIKVDMNVENMDVKELKAAKMPGGDQA